MPAVTLTTNTPIEMEGELYKVFGKVTADHLHLVRSSDQEVSKTSYDELVSKIFKGKAVIKQSFGKGTNCSRLRGKLQQDLDALGQKARNVFERKYAYVKGVMSYMPVPKSKDRIEPIIEEIASDRNDRNPPSFASVCRWLKDYEASGRDPRSLIPSYKDRGNRKRRLEEQVLEILSKAIDQRFLNIQQGSPTSVMDFVITEIHEENQYRRASEQLEVPDKRTIYREIEKLDTYTKFLKRHGKEVADRILKIVGKAPKATRPLERVEIDHTVLDLFVVDEETGMIVGRATITIAVDCYSRWILGFYIGFEPPGWQSVMHCLRHAMMPKENLRSLFPSIQNEWSCCGIPETIVVDNGREFHSKSFTLACEQLGIQIQYSPRAKPWFKGQVERVFSSINSKLLTGARGKTISRLLLETEYDPQKDAVVGLTQLTEAFCKWVVDVYVRDYHGGLKDTPANVWHAGIAENPQLRVPTSLQDFMVILSSVESRKIHKYGIEFARLRYQSEELGFLRSRLYQRENPSVSFKFDPSNLGHIHVKDPDTGEYLMVPAVELEYADGTNLWQHKVVNRWRYRQWRDSSRSLSLAQARNEIAHILSEARFYKLPIASSKKVGRFNGVGSNKVLENPISYCAKHDQEKLSEVSEDFGASEEAIDFVEENEGWGVGSNEDYPT